MPIITPTSRNLRKRNFEQLRPYTAERIQAKSQGIPVEVDKEVLRRENGIPENYDGYVEDETDLSFVENDVEELREVQLLHSEQEPQRVAKVLTNVNRQNVKSPILLNKSNVSRNIQNVCSSSLKKTNFECQRFSLSPTLFDDERSEEDGDDISID